MINLTTIDHVVFRVTDMERMIGWYSQVLRARVERELPDIGLVQLRAGASLIDLIPRDSGETGESPNVDHVCFGVLPWDGEAILAHLESHGITGLQVASRYGAQGHGPSIYLTDPEGNGVELKGPPWPPQRSNAGHPD